MASVLGSRLPRVDSMQAPLLFHLAVLAVVSLVAAGCSCGDDMVADAGAASDGARIDGAPSDAWNPFIPTDGGPLIHEPCAEGLEVRLVEWPSATVAPYGVMTPLLAGRDDALAALWVECEEGTVWRDCIERETGLDMGWASFAASTGAVMGGGLLRAADWTHPRGPIGLGWTEDSWRAYFGYSTGTDGGPRNSQIGWVDIDSNGVGASISADAVFTSVNHGEAEGTTFVSEPFDRAPTPDGGAPPPHRYIHVENEIARLRVLEGPAMRHKSTPVLSTNQRWMAFSGREQDSMHPMVARLDLDTGDVVFRELPGELFPLALGTPLPVASVDDNGQIIVSTRLFRSGRTGPPWRLRYIWLDRELRVQASWTSREEYTRGEWRSAVVGIGDAQLFVFVLHRGLFAGISRTPGSIEGAGRPLLLLGADRPAGLEHHRLEVWSTGSTAYAAVAYENELALVALKCDR